MKYNTFVQIFYKHRLLKAKKIRYTLLKFFLPLIYVINLLFDKKNMDLDDYSQKNRHLFEKNLDYLFDHFNSDKGKKFINQYQKPIKKNNEKVEGHSYHKFYENYLSKIKNFHLDILEIGSFRGNAVAALYFYLPKSKFTCVDLYPDLFLYRSKRIKNYYLDNSSEDQIQKKILKNEEKYDLVIEDAGHYYKDQIISLFKIFPKLKQSGIYVIEELDFPDTRSDMNLNNEHPTLKEILFSIKSNKDFHSTLISENEKEFFLSNYDTIEILKGSFNNICFIKKK
tara:strand:+ start:1620 stop:2468 length:849 start_codon:yes stop_codon:yes gene_type:complete